MSIKVSIVVPTYRTADAHLAALIESVDRQSMPAEFLELIFVDDGSPDDTLERIEKATTGRPRTQVKQIPNSGWPCRPRNVGTELASGEYVLYLDHDDVLFPEGMEHAYAFGAAHSADIVNIKEDKTKGWSWGWDAFAADVPPGEERHVSSLLPLTPHKLYRREFLRQQGIRFEESRRVLWEDIRFNLEAFARGARVAVFASYPCYHWVTHAANSSKTFGVDPAEKWRNLEELLGLYTEIFPPGEHRDEALLHTYRTRFLDRLGAWMLKTAPDRVAFEAERARAVAARYIPERLDAALSTNARARSVCLRSGDVDTARLLATIERRIGADVRTTAIHWVGSELRLTVEAELQLDGSVLYLTREDGRLLRAVDAPVRARLGADQLDFTSESEAGVVQLGLKARDTRENWRVGEPGPVPVTPTGDGRYQLRARHTAGIDILTGIFGRPLDRQPYDVSLSTTFLDRRFHRAAPAPDPLVSAALISGTGVIAYANRSGSLSLDVGERFRTVAAQAADISATVELTRHGKLSTIVINLPTVHVHGTTRLLGSLILKPSDGGESIEIPSTLTGADAHAELRSDPAALPAGSYAISTRFHGRTDESGKTVTVPARLGLARLRRVFSAARG